MCATVSNGCQRRRGEQSKSCCVFNHRQIGRENKCAPLASQNYLPPAAAAKRIVPEVDEAGPSGSIVLRNITDIVPREEYARRLGSARANKRKREEAKALHGDRGE